MEIISQMKVSKHWLFTSLPRNLSRSDDYLCGFQSYGTEIQSVFREVNNILFSEKTHDKSVEYVILETRVLCLQIEQISNSSQQNKDKNKQK